jgi:hypothetical protein
MTPLAEPKRDHGEGFRRVGNLVQGPRLRPALGPATGAQRH